MKKAFFISLFLALTVGLKAQDSIRPLLQAHNLLYSFKQKQVSSLDSIINVLELAEKMCAKVKNPKQLKPHYAIIYYRYKSLLYFFKSKGISSDSLKINTLDYAKRFLLVAENSLKMLKKSQETQKLQYLRLVCNIVPDRVFNTEIEAAQKEAKLRILKSKPNFSVNKEVKHQYKIIDRSRKNDLEEIMEEGEITYRSYSSTASLPKFPWQPPQASAYQELRRDYFKKAKTLADVEKTLRKALYTCGYNDIAYFSVQGGFVLVTRLEQIDDEGFSKKTPYRWISTRIGLTELSLKAYFKALFFGNPGYFRIIALVVSSNPVRRTRKKVEKDEAMAWLDSGAFSLPDNFKRKRFTKNYTCTALIYEFKQPESSKNAALLLPSNHTGNDHLEKSKLAKALLEQ